MKRNKEHSFSEESSKNCKICAVGTLGINRYILSEAVPHFSPRMLLSTFLNFVIVTTSTKKLAELLNRIGMGYNISRIFFNTYNVSLNSILSRSKYHKAPESSVVDRLESRNTPDTANNILVAAEFALRRLNQKPVI